MRPFLTENLLFLGFGAYGFLKSIPFSSITGSLAVSDLPGFLIAATVLTSDYWLLLLSDADSVAELNSLSLDSFYSSGNHYSLTWSTDLKFAAPPLLLLTAEFILEYSFTLLIILFTVVYRPYIGDLLGSGDFSYKF